MVTILATMGGAPGGTAQPALAAILTDFFLYKVKAQSVPWPQQRGGVADE